MARILLADDNTLIRRELARIIPRFNPQWEVCCTVSDGFAAVEQAAEMRPDLVILDFVMPSLDGISAARAIRALLPELPILLYSLMVLPNLEQAAREAGIDGVLEKGNPRALADEIRRLLGLKSGGTGSTATDAPLKSRPVRPND